jgi:tRNA threonylcarbamoyladenosine biosynthesis protein TsaE
MSCGKALASLVRSGTVVALEGTLGAGKSTLARGLLQALGVTGPITSPTYTLVNEYEIKLPATADKLTAYHVDLYRLQRPQEFELAGADEILYGEGVAVIEWSERAATLLPNDAIRVRIALRDDNTRLITATQD